MKFISSLFLAFTILATSLSAFALTRTGTIHLEGFIEERAELYIQESPEARNLRIHEFDHFDHIGYAEFMANGANITLSINHQGKLKNGDFFINYRLHAYVEEPISGYFNGYGYDSGSQVIFQNTTGLPVEGRAYFDISYDIQPDDFRRLRSGVYTDDVVITLTSN